jgi:tetratricopeptide (TPR) repeat protein
MSASQTDDLPADDQASAEVPAPRNFAERVAIVVVTMLVIGFVAVAFMSVVGPDVWTLWRRAKRVSAIQPVVEVTLPTSDDRAPDERPLDRRSTLAADAQIFPPHRRISSLAPPAGSLPEPADALSVVANAAAADPVQVPNAQNSPEAPSAEMADPATTLLDVAAQLVSRSWQDFDYPAPWYAGKTSKKRMVYSNHRNRLLNAVAHPQPSTLSLDFARKDYAAALTEFADDPRLDYVFGLALWKHGQFSEAIDMFQTAARLDEKPFLPAALAVAWGRFLNHDERRGLDQLQHIARVLATSSETYPPDAQKEQAAIAMGRALGYLSKPDRVPELADTVQLTAITLRKRLPEGLQGAFDSGFSDVNQRESELLRFVELPHDRLQAEHSMQRDDLQLKIDSLRTEMRDARNTVSRTHRSHVEAIADVLKEVTDVRGQVEKLRPKIEQLRESITKLATPQPHVETKTMPSHFDLVTGQGGQTALVQSNATMTVLLAETASERASRISKLSKTRDDLKKIQEDLSKLRDQQQDLVARRNAEDLQHRSDRDAARRERVVRLEEQRVLERKLQDLSKALRRTMTLREGFETIAAYIPWNVEIEGEALRLALNPKPVGRRTESDSGESAASRGLK